MLLGSKQYDKALQLFDEELKLSRKNNDKNYVMRLLLDIGRNYEGKREYAKAFDYSKNLLQNAARNNTRQYLRDGYQLMFILYGHIHNVDSAYFYYQQYTSMKDAVALGEFTKSLLSARRRPKTKKSRHGLNY